MSKTRINLRTGRPINNYGATKTKCYPLVPKWYYQDSSHLYPQLSIKARRERFKRMKEFVASILATDIDSSIVQTVSNIQLNRFSEWCMKHHVDLNSFLSSIFGQLNSNTKEIKVIKVEIKQLANSICSWNSGQPLTNDDCRRRHQTKSLRHKKKSNLGLKSKKP